jgi:UDP-glucose 4-epimerase
MEILVTGGCGQIGSTVIDMLTARGDDIVAIDNFATGRRDNLKPSGKVKLIEGTINDAALINQCAEITNQT